MKKDAGFDIVDHTERCVYFYNKSSLGQYLEFEKVQKSTRGVIGGGGFIPGGVATYVTVELKENSIFRKSDSNLDKKLADLLKNGTKEYISDIKTLEINGKKKKVVNFNCDVWNKHLLDGKLSELEKNGNIMAVDKGELAQIIKDITKPSFTKDTRN